jgi:hypothetical protein
MMSLSQVNSYFTPEGKLIYSGRAGTVIDQRELEKLWRKLQPLAIKRMPSPSGPVRPDRADLLDLQPGLCPSPERACLAGDVGGDHSGQGRAVPQAAAETAFKRIEEIFAKYPIEAR